MLHQISSNLLDRVLKLETNERKSNIILDGIKEQHNESEEGLAGASPSHGFILLMTVSFVNKLIESWKCSG